MSQSFYHAPKRRFSSTALLTTILVGSAGVGFGAAYLTVDAPVAKQAAIQPMAEQAAPAEQVLAYAVDPARFAAMPAAKPRHKQVAMAHSTPKDARPHAVREVMAAPRFMLAPGDSKEARLVGERERAVYQHAGFWRQETLVASAAEGRFDVVAKKASLTPEKLAAALKGGKGGVQPSGVEIAAARFGKPTYALAYAAPVTNKAALALEDMTAKDEDQAGVDIPQVPLDESVELPDRVPVPKFGMLPAERESKRAAKAKAAAAARQQDDDTDAPDSKPAIAAVQKPSIAADPKPAMRAGTKLAYARPDNPTKYDTDDSGNGRGWGLKNLFSRRAAGNGVAVYDISAAKVYMPDGSILEAHSGIGKMADNPRYTNVKMNGATPAHTYNLKMRESRFHGVEAIRMLPVDGKNKYGRTGLLTHSYLLRGRAAQSHGCVAFKDYSKFLNAYKQGKVKQLVVVPGGGSSAIARVFKNGRDT